MKITSRPSKESTAAAEKLAAVTRSFNALIYVDETIYQHKPLQLSVPSLNEFERLVRQTLKVLRHTDTITDSEVYTPRERKESTFEHAKWCMSIRFKIQDQTYTADLDFNFTRQV